MLQKERALFCCKHVTGLNSAGLCLWVGLYSYGSKCNRTTFQCWNNILWGMFVIFCQYFFMKRSYSLVIMTT